MTTPGPCGGMGRGVLQVCLSAPVKPAALDIAAPIAVAQAAFVASSAALAPGAAGVPAAAMVTPSATLMMVSETCFAACKAVAAMAGTPRHCSRLPTITLGLPGPVVKTGGNGCMTGSVILAAGLPPGILLPPQKPETARLTSPENL